MAFVFRNERKDFEKAGSMPGPGSYKLDLIKDIKAVKNAGYFGTKEEKFMVRKPLETPGPGAYNIDIERHTEKIIVSSETEDIKILEISRPHPVFKSGTKRFNHVPEEIQAAPGPGEYNLPEPIGRPKAHSVIQPTTNRPKILEQLISINKYQSIPSIPSNIHAYGYNQNDQNELELNRPGIETHKGEKGDIVGPGQYEANQHPVKPRCASWSMPKAKRLDEVKPPTGLGPGSYDVKGFQPICGLKPTNQFMSSTIRGSNQKKPSHSMKVEGEKQTEFRPNQSRASSKAPPSTHYDSDESDEYEYVDDTTPGPGSYIQISEPVRRNTKKTDVPLGGCSKRFAQESKPVALNLGPGLYDIGSTFKKAKPARVAAPIHEERVIAPINKQKLDQPGPGAYEPRNTMEDRLIYKIQRGYRGQFGSTEIRGRQPEPEQLPGPGQYDVGIYGDGKAASSVFKSNTIRRFIEGKGELPAPGSYNLNKNDIATRVIKEQEDDPDLVIRKPGFGVGQTRFKEAPPPEDNYQDDDIIKEIQEKHREEKKRKMLKNSAIFKSAEPRFEQSKINEPGPGAYLDAEEDHWNKKTFNILFADI